MAEVPQGASGLTGLDSGGTWAAGTGTLLRTEWAKHPRRCLEENMDHASDMPTGQRAWAKAVRTQIKNPAAAARVVGMDSATPRAGFLTYVAYALLVDSAAAIGSM